MTTSLTDQGDPSPSKTVELRVALAMRGGVSLAVWIGGACAEIDAMRRALLPDEQGPCEFWRTLLTRAGYDRVAVDVLAGASAGGLNGVLYAASQIYDFPFSAMRQVWLDVAGTEALVRRENQSSSLFKGDEYFLEKLHENLGNLSRASAHRERSTPIPAIDLTLSATHIEPVERPVASPADELLVERRFATGFRFRQPSHLTAWTGTHFPPAGDAGFGAAIRRLAVAGRATSSFPGAFEAAAVWSARPGALGGDPPSGNGANHVDMSGVFLDRRGVHPDDPFIVADGGILDNIPIQRALDAIAAAPADSSTRRVLIYLQPGATRPPAAHREASIDRRRSSVNVLRGVMQSRLSGETINDDITLLESYNDSIASAATLRVGTFARITSPEQLEDAARERGAGYIESRAANDARQMFALLSSPVATLGEDPFPSTFAGQPVLDDKWRSPIGRWPQHQRELLRSRLVATFDALLRATPRHGDGEAGLIDPFAFGTRPLVRVTHLLIEWAGYREALFAGEASEQASTSKARLYRVAAALDQIVVRPRSLGWVAAAAVCPEADVGGFARQMSERLGRLCFLPETTVQGLVDALNVVDRQGDDAALATARAVVMRRIEDVVGDDAPIRPGDVDVRRRILEDVLVPLVVELAAAGSITKKPRGPASHLDDVLEDISKESDVVERLAALEILCYSEFAIGLPGRRPVEFVRLSSANRTPLAPAFTTVLAAAKELGLWWGEETCPTKQEGIHVDLKLAGNELANFAAFLLPQWRANDWLWGRLDAVPTLVGQLVTPTTVARMVPADGDWAPFDAAFVPADHPWRSMQGPPTLDERLHALHEEAEGVKHLLGQARNDAPTPLAWDAMIAQRQFAIIAEELALPQQPGGATRPLGPEETWREIAVRPFGSQTIKDPALQEPLTDRLNELATAFSSTLVWNVDESKILPLSAKRQQLARRLIGNLAQALAGRFLGQRGNPLSRTKRLALTVGAAALAALAVAGFLIDKSAFLIGALVGLVPSVLSLVLVWRWVRPLFVREPTTTDVPPAPASPEHVVGGVLVATEFDDLGDTAGTDVDGQGRLDTPVDAVHGAGQLVERDDSAVADDEPRQFGP